LKRTTRTARTPAAYKPQCWLACAVFALATLVTCFIGLHGNAEAAGDFWIVVHPDSSVTSVHRRFLAQAFLKNVSRWDNGEVIRPVDQRTDAPVRRRFSEAILERSVDAVKAYWQQRIFSGRGVPPPELESDDAVVDYVQHHPGAVGYVSRTSALGKAKLIIVN
jgi:ABC-type phosphate transport system substrate-binding protein